MAEVRKKFKCLYLMKIFLEETDEDHVLTISQLSEQLQKYGFDPVSPKTLYEDIEELRRFGVNVEYDHEGRSYFYRVLNRDFHLAELKLLVDSVQASKFITESKSAELIKKLEKLASRHQGQELQRQVLITGRVKSMNESIYYNVDAINNAINLNSQITFQYFQYDREKNQVLRHDGALYVVSPWALVLDNENYYLVAYDEKASKIKHYRVDKMLKIQQNGMPRNGHDVFNRESYARKSVFGMFGGKLTPVTLEASNDMAGILIDRFGKDIAMIPIDDEHFETRVEVALSLQFYGWLIGLGPGIRLTGPMPAVKELRAHIRRLSEQYLDS